jgi:3',5'-cyclic-AMP phosphodiesterase
MAKFLKHNHEKDGIDRRGFLECMAWAGTGVVWSLAGGVARGQVMDHGAHVQRNGFDFVQISDSHIGFNKEANQDVTATLREAVARINALEHPPAFLIHTGDITHLSKPEQFDTAEQILKTAKVGEIFYVPGEHDVLSDDGKMFLERHGKAREGAGWYSFDHQGVHLIGLVNVLNLKAGGLGNLGDDQLEWLRRDLAGLTSSTPIVVFAHMPLWTVYPEWGWGTDDGMQALSYLKRFGSVTVLNGHIHQVMQKTEGNMSFHTACSTAFPQPKPGTAPSPGPMTVPAEQLRGLLGLTEVHYIEGKRGLALVDSTLDAAPVAAGAATDSVRIDNFSFNPPVATAAAGTRITWTNHDDIPHNVVSNDKSFASPVLDTDEKFSYSFVKPGEYAYYCSLHPRMTGRVIVK